MAGTHEENMKDPAWLGEQITRYKDELRKLQEKHDAQLAGIAEDKKTIASLNEALAEAKSKATGYETAIANLETALRHADANLQLSKSANADLLAQFNAATALAKNRRTALAEVMKVISPVLAAE